MNDTPTPMTDEVEDKIVDLSPNAECNYALMKAYARKLERELTAAQEEIAELKEEYGTWWAQKRIAIDELKEVTEQRDRLAEALKECREDSISLISFQRKEGYYKSIIVTEKHIKDATEALQYLNQANHEQHPTPKTPME